MSDLTNVEIIFDKAGDSSISYQEELKGIVRIKANEQVDISQIVVKLQYESSGKLDPNKYVIDQQALPQTQMIMAPGEEHEFPFTLTQSSKSQSYKGKNVSILFSVEASVELEGDKQGAKILKKISTFFTGDKGLKASKYITVSQNTSYAVIADETSLSLKNNIILVLPAILVFVGIFAFLGYTFIDNLFSETGAGYMFIALVLSIGFGIFVKRIIIKTVIGRFKAFVTDNDTEAFSCSIESQKGWKHVSSASCEYQAVERVVDTRGTTDSVYQHTVYTSPSQKVSQDNFGEVKLVFAYPDKDIPIKLAQDASIIWKIVLTIATPTGITLKYLGAFGMTKK